MKPDSDRRFLIIHSPIAFKCILLCVKQNNYHLPKKLEENILGNTVYLRIIQAVSEAFWTMRL